MIDLNIITISNESAIKTYPLISEVKEHKKWMKENFVLLNDYDKIKINWHNQIIIVDLPKIDYDIIHDYFKIIYHKNWIENHLNNQIKNYIEIYVHNDDDFDEPINMPIL